MKKAILSILFIAALAALYVTQGGSLDFSSVSNNSAPAGSSTQPMSSDEAALKSLKF